MAGHRQIDVALTFAVALACSVTSVAWAQEVFVDPDASYTITDEPADLAAAPDDDDWHLTATPYVFIPSNVDADSTVGGVTLSLDLDFDDIMDNFDVLGFSTLIELRRGDWGLFSNIVFVKLDSDEFHLETPVPAPPARVTVNIEQFEVDLGLMYRLVHLPVGEPTNGEQAELMFDVLVGGRIMSYKQQVEVNLGAGVGKPGGRETWVEPIIGGKIELEGVREWSFIVGGAVGGFGIGSASDLTANLVAGVGYRPADWIQLRFEYQFFFMDYSRNRSDGEFGFDGTIQGPWLGASIDF